MKQRKQNKNLARSGKTTVVMFVIQLFLLFDKTESGEPTEPTEPTDSTDSSDSTDSGDSTDSMSRVLHVFRGVVYCVFCPERPLQCPESLQMQKKAIFFEKKREKILPFQKRVVILHRFSAHEDPVPS